MSAVCLGQVDLPPKELLQGCQKFLLGITLAHANTDWESRNLLNLRQNHLRYLSCRERSSSYH